MKKSFLIILFLTFGLISCKTYYKEPQEIKYDCVLGKVQFLADIKQILIDEGFTINNVDDFRGYIIAEKMMKNSENKEVLLNISLRYDSTTHNYFVSPSAIVMPRDSNEIEYYTETCIRKEYKPQFRQTLDRMKYFCKGGYFPNR